MSESIQSHSKLLVISDTGIYQENENFYAFGPVVKELHELDFFDQIVWIGFSRTDQKNNRSYVKILDKNIEIKTIKRTGGSGIWEKILILIQYPKYFKVIYKEILKAKYIHVRAPSNPAVIGMFLSLFFPEKKFWFKYAGDWKGKTSFFYNQQRKWLKKLNNNAVVTVNGIWDKQPKNIISFENRCLDEKDRELGKKVVENKKLSPLINYCFVGGLNENKGILTLLKALESIDLGGMSVIFHIVGEGL